MTQIKRARRNQVNTLEKRQDRSERELQLYLGASVSFELPLSSASLPPSTKLSGTEHHCQAATSLHHQNILHCLHLQLCSSMFNRLSPDGRVSQKPWTHRGWKSTPSLHIASTCIYLQFSGTSRPTCYSAISTCSIFSVQHIWDPAGLFATNGPCSTLATSNWEQNTKTFLLQRSNDTLVFGSKLLLCFLAAMSVFLALQHFSLHCWYPTCPWKRRHSNRSTEDCEPRFKQVS